MEPAIQHRAWDFLPNPFINEVRENLEVRDEVVERVLRLLSADAERGEGVDARYQGEIDDVAGLKKLDRNASLILAGLLVGCTANIELTKKEGVAFLRRA